MITMFKWYCWLQVQKFTHKHERKGYRNGRRTGEQAHPSYLNQHYGWHNTRYLWDVPWFALPIAKSLTEVSSVSKKGKSAHPQWTSGEGISRQYVPCLFMQRRWFEPTTPPWHKWRYSTTAPNTPFYMHTMILNVLNVHFTVLTCR
jgi:hypothetical protein